MSFADGIFHNVCHAPQAEFKGNEGNRAHRHPVPALVGYFRIVRPLMQEMALRRAHILLPLALHMDQRPLPRAEGEVLYAGKRKEIVFAEFILHRRHLGDKPGRFSIPIL